MEYYYVNHISYSYGKNHEYDILHDVHFRIYKGKITAVVGPSGSGKTTLLEVMTKVIPKLISNGALTGGFDIDENHLISAVSQVPENQLFGYSVEDAIAFGIENMGLPPQEISARMEHVLKLLRIEALRRKSIDALSGGQKQAVCIASVLAMSPDILVMDEPVSSLDPDGKNLIHDVLKSMKAEGNATVVFDNNLAWLADIADYVIGLKDGRIVFNGTTEEFFNNFAAQDELGVIIPQELALYRELKNKFSSLHMFYTLDDALKELADRDLIFQKKNEVASIEEENNTIISVKNLTKIFDKNFSALKNVEVSFEEGKITTILGQNGSGKTTLVKHLNGLLRPTEGDVLFKDTSILERSVAQISEDIILVFQHPEHMLFEDTVEEELTFCSRIKNIPVDKEEVDQVLKKYDLYEYQDEFPLNLSMGQKHMLTILSVLLSPAKVVILDEPTLGMDSFLISRLKEIILDLKRSGKTVILISHEIPFVFEITDNIILLNYGDKLFSGTKRVACQCRKLFESVNIHMPPVTELAFRMGMEDVPFSVQEFVDNCSEKKQVLEDNMCVGY